MDESIIPATPLEYWSSLGRLEMVVQALAENGDVNVNGPVHHAAKVGPTVFEVYPLAEGSADSTTRLGFAMDDLEKVLAALQSKEMPKQTPWGMRAVVRDPDGGAVELCQHGGQS